jgi:NAD(P)-dependent dehydrogenase (short-subunit alcohol dehydrogenase family)
MKINELFNVSGKVAVVTGGSRGIGEMIAAGFLANGVKVYITARKEAALIEKDGMEEFAAFMKSKEEHIDFLINNAGASWGEPYADYSEKGWDKVMDLNVKSIFYLTQKLTPMLAIKASNEDPARVINIGSIDGLNVPALESYAYGTSKAAVHHLTRVLAKKLVGDNILVNAIAPGPYESMMLGAAVNHDYSLIESRNPRKRIGSPEDMAGLVIFLCSRAGAYTVGAVIPSDGGLVGTAGHDLSQS